MKYFIEKGQLGSKFETLIKIAHSFLIRRYNKPLKVLQNQMWTEYIAEIIRAAGNDGSSKHVIQGRQVNVRMRRAVQIKAFGVALG